MDLRLFEVQRDDEFRELFYVFRAAFTDPGTKLWPLFTGDYRSDPSQREAALEEATQRFISWHRSDPTSHWLKVVDKGTGRIVGGGRWGLFDTENPYEGHDSMEAAWWPEGQPREFASICLNQFLATSAKHMNKPHACKFALLVTDSLYLTQSLSLEYLVRTSRISSKGCRFPCHEVGHRARRQAGTRVFRRSDQRRKAVL